MVVRFLIFVLFVSFVGCFAIKVLKNQLIRLTSFSFLQTVPASFISNPSIVIECGMWHW